MISLPLYFYKIKGMNSIATIESLEQTTLQIDLKKWNKPLKVNQTLSCGMISSDLILHISFYKSKIK